MKCLEWTKNGQKESFMGSEPFAYSFIREFPEYDQRSHSDKASKQRLWDWIHFHCGLQLSRMLGRIVVKTCIHFKIQKTAGAGAFEVFQF